MSQPTERKLACWRQIEELMRAAFRRQRSAKIEFVELDARGVDQLKELLLELDYERHVR